MVAANRINTGQRQPRRSTKYSMPDTDDEGSVADNASDAGGITGNMAATAGGRGDGTTQVQVGSWGGGRLSMRGENGKYTFFMYRKDGFFMSEWCFSKGRWFRG